MSEPSVAPNDHDLSPTRRCFKPPITPHLHGHGHTLELQDDIGTRIERRSLARTTPPATPSTADLRPSR